MQFCAFLLAYAGSFQYIRDEPAKAFISRLAIPSKRARLWREQASFAPSKMIARVENPIGTPVQRRLAKSLAILLLSWAAGRSAAAQTLTTVQQNEFRSRWADFQVDRPPADTTATGAPTEEQEGLLGTIASSLYNLFRTRPFQLRADLSAGWEFSNQNEVSAGIKNPSDSSFFIAPAIGFFYNREFGPVTLSARYSAGDTYYLDHNYTAAGSSGGIFSQTGGFDLKAEGDRTVLTSSAGASYGNGIDIESGEERTEFSISENFEADYVITPFSQLGTTASINYGTDSGGTVASTDTLNDSDTIYIQYLYTPKTTGRLELSAGQEYQSGSGVGINGIDSGDRWYYQALLVAGYLPDTKLNLSIGAGYGVQNDVSILGKGTSGGHPVYRITVSYAPTDKTKAAFQFGDEGVDVGPSLSLAVSWEFRLATTANLSVYQSTGFSSYEVAQNVITRGVLASVQQRLFGRVDLLLSAGTEQSKGYGQLVAGQQPANQDPYYFGGVSLLMPLNSYLSVQGYIRESTGDGEVTNQKGIVTQASLSLRLTF